MAVLVFQAKASELKDISRKVSDSVITAKITAKYTESRLLNPFKLAVSTKNGVVTLNGYVKSREAFVQALRLALRTQGVKAVDVDKLEIKKINMALTDVYITAKVETAVLKAKVLDDESIPLVGINASTTNGVVTLSGKVKRTQSIGAILKRVSSVRGVKKIISQLKVCQAKL